jgi:hypothetical protein
MTFTSRLAFALAATAVLAVPAVARTRIYPAWSLAGAHELEVPPGFTSVSGEFRFPIAGKTATFSLRYEDKLRLSGTGLVDLDVGPTLFALTGRFTVDDAGVQHVHLADVAKPPLFSFDGTVDDATGDISGTFVREDGYLEIATGESGALTLDRTDGAPQTALTLSFRTRMDTFGKVRAALESDGSDSKASLTLYGGTVLADGKIRGRVVTGRDARTRAVLTILGPGWRAKLAGPVDQTGFHAACNLKGGGFVVTGVPLVLAVQPGPTPPPGPPPPPPKNQLLGGTATIADGKVTITHSDVPSKFFGAPAGLRIEFPSSLGQTVVHADPSSATLPEPDPRRFIVTVGTTTFGTASAPADVEIDIRKITATQIEVLATGTVVAQNGKKKPVDVFVVATIQ